MTRSRDDESATQVKLDKLGSAIENSSIDEIKEIDNFQELLNEINIRTTFNNETYTAFQYAVLCSKPEFVKFMIDNGADAALKNDTNYRGPFLCRAVRLSYTTHLCSNLKLLFEHKANVNVTDEYGTTPLHHAVWENHPSVPLLLEYGADVNAKNINGDTTLHYSIAKEAHYAIQLIKYGAKVHEKNKRGKTALEDAEYRESKGDWSSWGGVRFFKNLVTDKEVARKTLEENEAMLRLPLVDKDAKLPSEEEGTAEMIKRLAS